VTNIELLKRLKVKYFDKKDHSDKKKAIMAKCIGLGAKSQ
jgi:hypothetical protein